jgi:hypothetical protein
VMSTAAAEEGAKAAAAASCELRALKGACKHVCCCLRWRVTKILLICCRESCYVPYSKCICRLLQELLWGDACIMEPSGVAVNSSKKDTGPYLAYHQQLT